MILHVCNYNNQISIRKLKRELVMPATKSKMEKSIFRFYIVFLLAMMILVSRVDAQHKTNFEFIETASAAVRQTMQNNTNAVFNAIREANFSGRILANHATPEAIDRIRALWSASSFYCSETDVIAQVLKSAEGWQVRNIPIYFERGETDEERCQNMIIEFTPGGLISNVCIAIPMNEYYQIIETRDTDDLRRRLLIAGFVDNFLTAYYLRDTNYLEQLFSDRRHMQMIRKALQQSEYFNIKFSEIEVLRHPEKRNFYGVTIRQDWKTSTYDNAGWIFLLMDFTIDDKSRIWVQTWQPISVPRNKVIGPDFYNVDR